LQIKTIDFDLQGTGNLARQHIQAAWLKYYQLCRGAAWSLSDIDW